MVFRSDVMPLPNEKQARKLAERQAVVEAMVDSAPPIEFIVESDALPAEPSDPLAGLRHLLTSPRVRLRNWADTDREPFAALTSDEEVMRHFPAVLTRGQSDAWIDRTMARIAARGWGFWALDYLAPGELEPRFAGFTGLNVPDPQLPIGPSVEVGWRLARPFWGLGIASEAARMALSIGFDTLKLDEVVAVTTQNNIKSQAVMRRLAMRESPADAFDHPSFPVTSRERHCCIYRLPREVWLHNTLTNQDSRHA